MKNLAWFAGLLVISAVAHAEDWTTTKRACQDAQFFHGLQFHNAEECAVDFFTLDRIGQVPLGPAFGSVTTGSGFGAGIHSVIQPTANDTVTIKGLYTYNSSFIFGGQYQHNFRVPWRNMISGQQDLTKGNLFATAVHFDLHSQDFYGLGPNSSLAGHAVYGQHETWFGLQGYVPLHSTGRYFGLLGLSGQAKYLRPSTSGVNGESLPSVQALYGESGAPGSTQNPDFVAAGVGLDVRTPTSKPRIWEHHEAQVTYTHFSELSSKQFSFDRLEGFANVSFDLSKSLPKPAPGQSLLDAPERSWFSRMLCMESSRNRCAIGSVSSTTMVTASYVAAGSTVPFVLQPTLGGADFQGVDTLRGLVDYRLRAPNRLLTQVDFDKSIANLGIKGHPIGQYGLYCFFDAGNVAANPGQLGSQSLRKDVGVGVSIAVQNKIVLRAYIAFGAGEGSHPNAKAANTFATTPEAIGTWMP